MKALPTYPGNPRAEPCREQPPLLPVQTSRSRTRRPSDARVLQWIASRVNTLVPWRIWLLLKFATKMVCSRHYEQQYQDGTSGRRAIRFRSPLPPYTLLEDKARASHCFQVYCITYASPQASHLMPWHHQTRLLLLPLAPPPVRPNAQCSGPEMLRMIAQQMMMGPSA